MAQKSQVLQAENAKLRHEIRSLQSALKDINRDQSPSYPGKVPNSNKKKEQSPLVSRQRREKLRREIEDKLDRGVFSPPKSPALSRNRSREDKTSEAQSIVKQSVSTDTMHFIASFGPSQIRETPISRENPYQTKESVRIETEEPSFEDSDYLNADKQSDYNNSISQELGQIKDTVDGLYASIESLDRDMLEESEKSLRNT